MSADLPLTRVMLLVPSVIAKYRRAVSNNEESSQYFDLISQAVDDDLQQKWEKEISAAEHGRLDRPELMDIMGNQLKNGMCEAIISFPACNKLASRHTGFHQGKTVRGCGSRNNQPNGVAIDRLEN